MSEELTISATALKRHLGKYLDTALTRPVVIERQGRPTAVLISVDEYEALNPSASKTIDRLTAEFDALVARMQAAEVQEALDRAFEASGEELGAAHARAIAIKKRRDD